MKKKKILIIHNILWSHYKAKVFSELYNNYKKEYEFFFIQIAANESGRSKLGQVDLTIHNYPYKLLFQTTYESVNKFKLTLALINEVRKFQPNIVVVPGYNGIANIILLFYTRLKNIKTITTVDSTKYDHPRWVLKETFKKFILNFSDFFFCYGKRAKEYLNELGVENERIHIRVQATHNKIITDCYAKYKESNPHRETVKFKNTFIYVGRLSEEKNINTLLYSFKDCLTNSASAKNWGLIIVGDGPTKESHIKLCETLSIKDHVMFIGGLTWSEVVAYYAFADVFVLPSLSEPWGLVVNEAMLCHLPIIASDHVGAVPELITPENGFIFEPNSTTELSKILNKFIHKEVDLEVMGNKSAELISTYTPENSATQMVTLFRKILRKDVQD